MSTSKNCGSKALETLLMGILLILHLIFTPILIITVLVPVLFVRLLAIGSAKLFLPAGSRILSPVSGYLANDPTATLTFVGHVEGLVDREDYNFIRDSVGSSYPEFCQVLRRWFGFWFLQNCQDPNFRVQDHVDFRMDLCVTEEEALQMADDLNKTPFDPNRPPWKVVVRELARNPNQSKDTFDHVVNFDREKWGGRRSVIIIHTHHCFTDGYSMVEFVRRIVTTDFEISVPRVIPKGVCNGLLMWLKLLTVGPVKAFMLGLKFHRDGRHLQSLTSSDKVFKYADEGPSLDTIRNAAKRHGVTVTAVLFEGLTEALRLALLKIRDIDNASDEQKSLLVPDELPVLVPYPVPSQFSNKRSRLTNKLAMAPLSAPVGVPDRLSRLHMIHSRLEAIKNSELPLVFYVGFLCFTLTLSFFKVTKGTEKTMYNLGFLHWTNFPGPKEPFCVSGKFGSRMIPSVGRSLNLPLGISTFCVNGKINVSVKADQKFLPSVEMTKEFVHDMVNEFQQLLLMEPLSTDQSSGKSRNATQHMV